MYKTNEILINMLWTFAVCLLFGCPCGNLLSLVLCRRPSRCGPNQIEYAMNCKTQKFCIKRKKKTTKIHQQHQPLSYSANGQPEKKLKKMYAHFSAHIMSFFTFSNSLQRVSRPMPQLHQLSLFLLLLLRRYIYYI